MLADTCPHDIASARLGDRQALERVLVVARQDLRRYAEHHCVVNDVEDAVQETLLTMARRLHALRMLDRYAAWAFRIVKRECNRMKRGKRWVTGEEITEDICPIVLPPPHDLRRDVACAIESLPAHYREVLLLRDLDGMTIAEICAATGLTREAAKARLHRARAMAREYLEP